MHEITVVIVTRNRIESLLRTLGQLTALPENPPIIITDNGSTDGTPQRVRDAFPQVTVLELGRNHGCSGRNFGVKHARTPLIAFCDDDSWWEPGALTRAAGYFRQYPHLGVLAGRVLVGEDQHEDPVCEAMRTSPITSPKPLPGPAVLGFVCCAAVVRRDAFLEVGGFHPAFGIAGEERMFSVDMRTKGWALAYVEEVVGYHHPSKIRNPGQRTKTITRDTIWYYCLRRPWKYALKHLLLIMKQCGRDADIRRGYIEALRAAPRILMERRVVPPAVEEQILKIESFY
ncbi:glycosyltransferase family 2 protein [Larkinella soli]|uniref:glycosyltransferase family 2 protein n=1 Tax=Larkinella soli TaxID=1770527 RepID=UPI000FFB9D97|nr:glycosyltransferase [Larkinella soli]